MKKLFLISFILINCIMTFAQTKELPALAYKGTNNNYPLIFYISGDGGWNSFSTGFINSLNKQGYPVIALNSKSYFWTKKTAQQATNDVSSLINRYIKNWNIKSIVLI